MKSIPASKLFCYSLALLSAILIGDSLAFKCNVCEKQCSIKECSPDILTPDSGTKLVCISLYHGKEGIVKRCAGDKDTESLIGGTDRCKEIEKKTIQIREIKKVYMELRNQTPGSPEEFKTEQEFINENLEKIDPKDLMGTVTMCSCSTELCNTDEADKKLRAMAKSKGANIFGSWFHRAISILILMAFVV